jgi:hypothetical protein
MCGELTIKAQRKLLSPLVRKAYELYFGFKVSDEDKDWASEICCILMFEDIDRLIKRHTHTFCCTDGLA